MAPIALAQHLGALHPVETLAMAALALGPFVILAVVVTVVSRRDRRADRAGQATRDEPDPAGRSDSTTTDTAAPQSVQQ